MLEQTEFLQGEVEVQHLPVAAIAASPNNPRVFRDGDQALKDLAASIAALGVHSPVLVRPIDSFTIKSGKRGKKPGFFVIDERLVKNDGEYQGILEERFYTTTAEAEANCPRYELMAGERRWRASRMAGKATIPTIVREVSDARALEITVTENLQREDLHPLEECNGIARLLDQGHWTIDQVANELGKSVKFVARRASLTRLASQWREAFLGNDEVFDLSGWSASHQERISSLPAEMQAQLFEAAHADFGRWRKDDFERFTLTELNRFVGVQLHTISQAPWKIDDDSLGGCGACKTCTNRSSVQPELWDDDAGSPGVCSVCGCTEDDPCIDDEDGACSWADGTQTICTACVGKARKGGGTADRCLSVPCWNKKMKAFLEGREDELRSKHPNLVLIGEGKGHVSQYFAVGCKKSDNRAQPALYMDGPKSGQFAWVGLYGSSASQAKKQGGDAPAPMNMKERREKLKKMRQNILYKLLLERMHEAAALDLHTVLRLALSCGIAGSSNGWAQGYSSGASWHQFDEFEKKTDQELVYDLQQRALWIIERSMRQSPSESEAKRICKALSIDYDALWDAAVKKKPEPKAWKDLNADGTPKAAAAKASAPAKGKKVNKAA